MLILAELCDSTSHQKHKEQEECEHQISGNLECFYENTTQRLRKQDLVFATIRRLHVLAIDVVRANS